jgi:hypothetical protein
MSLTVVFFVVLIVLPIAYFVSRQFEKPVPFFATWAVAALIVICCLIAFVLRTVDTATGGETGWGKTYKDIGEGKFE